MYYIVFLAEIKLQIGCVPATWDGASFQSLKLVQAIPLGFGYSEGSGPLGRQLVLQLIRMSLSDENQIKKAFINEGRGHSPSHLKFFLLVFSKLKEDIK